MLMAWLVAAVTTTTAVLVMTNLVVIVGAWFFSLNIVLQTEEIADLHDHVNDVLLLCVLVPTLLNKIKTIVWFEHVWYDFFCYLWD